MTGPGSLPDIFFDDVRDVLLADKQLSDIDIGALAEIAADPEMSRAFSQRFAESAQNPEVSEIVVDAVKRLITNEEMSSGRRLAHMDTIDRYAGRLGLSAMIGGVGALLIGPASSGAVAAQGGIVLAAIGTAMMVTSAAVRTILNRKAHASVESQRHLETLLARLERRIERTTDA